ncbi:MAG TPA: OmpA family protein [Pyrinomonadaceae bacterium]|nr:OmpA family protein [Pyrinomonadaceae bacterium]
MSEHVSKRIAEVTLQTATHLAACGQYRAASELLDSSDASQDSLSGLLLRAKIAVQQGRFDGAINYWRKVLAMVTDNQEAKQGIDLAQQLKVKRGSRFYLRANFYYAVLMLIIVGLVALLIVVGARNARSTDAAMMSAIGDKQDQQLQLQRQIAQSLPSSSSSGGQNSPARLAHVEISAPGISVQKERDELLLLFEKGLFDSGRFRIKREEEKTLSLLADQLKPNVGRISVTIYGHTDNVAMSSGNTHRDNIALGWARAVEVVEFLRTKAQLPASMFAIRGPREHPMIPYSNDTIEGRARNRTVVIRISGVESD